MVLSAEHAVGRSSVALQNVPQPRPAPLHLTCSIPSIARVPNALATCLLGAGGAEERCGGRGSVLGKPSQWVCSGNLGKRPWRGPPSPIVVSIRLLSTKGALMLRLLSVGPRPGWIAFYCPIIQLELKLCQSRWRGWKSPGPAARPSTPVQLVSCPPSWPNEILHTYL